MRLAELLGRPDWMADTLCTEYPELPWFPVRGQPTAPAKAVCARCLVRVECLAFALDNEITDGVWGGVAGRELRATARAA